MRPRLLYLVCLILQFFAWQVGQSDIPGIGEVIKFTEAESFKNRWLSVYAATPPLLEEQTNSTIDNPIVLHALIDYGLSFAYKERYKKAEEVWAKLVNLYPKSPIGYFYTAAFYQDIMRNYRVRTFEAQFDKYIELAINKGEKAVKKDRNDAISYLYLGRAYGYRAIQKLQKQRWFGAFRDGLRGASRMEKALKIDPTLYDAYYGIGIYHYWRSVRSRAFWFLPFIGDNRRKGIDELWLSIEEGKHSKIEGEYALVTIYYNEGDYDTAWELNQQLYQLFPNHPATLYMRGLILEKQRRWKEALEVFQKLLSHLLASEYQSIGYQLECHYRTALYLYQQGRLDEAIKEIKIVWQLEKQRNPDKELEDTIGCTEDILRDAKKLYKELLKQR